MKPKEIQPAEHINAPYDKEVFEGAVGEIVEILDKDEALTEEQKSIVDSSLEFLSENQFYNQVKESFWA